MAKEAPDLEALIGIVAPNVLDAMRVADEALTRLGVRHLLVGGLAIGAYGYPRATKDVDFLVGEEAFEHHAGGLVTMKPGMPIEVRGVVIDFLSATQGESHLDAALRAPGGDGIRVAPSEVIAYLKLKSPRARDRSDLIELVKVGLDVKAVRAYLSAHAAEMIPKWEAIVADARAEE